MFFVPHDMSALFRHLGYKEELLSADIEAFTGKYENLIKILEKAINEKN